MLKPKRGSLAPKVIVLVAVCFAAGVAGGMVGARLERPPRTGVVADEGLAVVGDGGQVRIRLAVTETGDATLRLADAKGAVRADLAVSSLGVPTLAFRDRDGTVRMQLTQPNAGGPVMSFMDTEGELRFGFGLDAEGMPQFRQPGSWEP